MATAKTTAAKAKSDQEAADAAKTETPSGADDAATPTAPEVRPEGTDVKPGSVATAPGDGKPEETDADSASAALKSRRQAARDSAADDRVPTQVFDYGDKPTELSPEQVDGQNGLPQFHPGGPETLPGTPFSGYSVSSSAHVFPKDDGFISYLPENSKTPVTVRVWSKGQAVRKDIHEHYRGKASDKPETSKVLDGKDVLVSR